MVIHDLSHGGGGASGHAIFRVYLWALEIERRILPPLALGERANNAARLGGDVDLRGSLDKTLIEHVNFVDILVEPLLHDWGHIVGVKITLVAVAQHLLGAVVTADDNIAVAWLSVEHIVGGTCLRAGIAQPWGLHGHRGGNGAQATLLHESGGNGACVAFVHLSGLQHAGCKQCYTKGKN